MKLFLQVGLTQLQQNKVGNLFLKYASSLAADVMGTDLNSDSAPIITNMVSRLVDQSQSVFLLVVADDANVPLGAANEIFNSLQDKGEKVAQVVIYGDHRTAELVLGNFHPRFTKENNQEKIKELIRNFSLSTAATN